MYRVVDTTVLQTAVSLDIPHILMSVFVLPPTGQKNRWKEDVKKNFKVIGWNCFYLIAGGASWSQYEASFWVWDTLSSVGELQYLVVSYWTPSKVKAKRAVLCSLPPGSDIHANLFTVTYKLTVACSAWSSVVLKGRLQQSLSAFITTKRKPIGCRILRLTKNALAQIFARRIIDHFKKPFMGKKGIGAHDLDGI